MNFLCHRRFDILGFCLLSSLHITMFLLCNAHVCLCGAAFCPETSSLTGSDGSLTCGGVSEPDTLMVWREEAINADIYMKNATDYYLKRWDLPRETSCFCPCLCVIKPRCDQSIKSYCSADSSGALLPLWPLRCRGLGPFV